MFTGYQKSAREVIGYYRRSMFYYELYRKHEPNKARKKVAIGVPVVQFQNWWSGFETQSYMWTEGAMTALHGYFYRLFATYGTSITQRISL